MINFLLSIKKNACILPEMFATFYHYMSAITITHEKCLLKLQENKNPASASHVTFFSKQYKSNKLNISHIALHDKRTF
jgi:hypothetical protein